jgi:hypothetical protein
VNRILKSSNRAARDAKDIKELIPEGLLIRVFARSFAPTPRKGEGAMANFIPGDIWHRSSS